MGITGRGVNASRCVLAIALAGCGQAQLPPAPPPPPLPPPLIVPQLSRVELDAGPPDASLPQATPDAGVGMGETVGVPEGPAPACPAGMMLVDTSYCPLVDRKCLEE